MNTKSKTAILGRIDITGLDFYNQIPKCIRYAEKNALQVSAKDIYQKADLVLNGHDLTERQDKELLHAILCNKYKHVIIYSIESVVWGALEFIDFLKTLKECEVELHCVTEKINQSTPTGIFDLHLKIINAEFNLQLNKSKVC